jgi:hypothetical protein
MNGPGPSQTLALSSGADRSGTTSRETQSEEVSSMRGSALLFSASLLALTAAPVAAQDASAPPSAANPSQSAEPGTAMVRVLHASPDAPAVDIYLDGALVGAPLAGLVFGQLSPYVPVPAGTHAVKVCATADATVCPIDVPALAVEAGTDYTIAATNALASIEPQVLVDSGIPDPAKALVRVVHFSADTPSVDVLTQDGATKVVSALTYPNATDYLSLDPASYDLKVCASSDSTVCPIDPPALDLAAGSVSSVFAIGSLANGSITAIVASDLPMAGPAESPMASPAESPAMSPSASGM